jgi:hypothetical protein
MAEGGRAFIELLREDRRAPDNKRRDKHERPEEDTR